MMIFDKSTDPILRAQILSRYVGELMTDSERARFYGLPEGCRIRERTKILAPEKFTCGRFVWIGEGAVLDAQGGLEIGDYTQIGLSVMVWSRPMPASPLSRYRQEPRHHPLHKDANRPALFHCWPVGDWPGSHDRRWLYSPAIDFCLSRSAGWNDLWHRPTRARSDSAR